MKKLFLTLSLMGLFYIPKAAFEVQMINAENTACGNIISIWPGGLNFATTMEEEGLNFRAAYTNLFGLKELSHQSVNLSWKNNENYGISCRMNTFGDDLYRESLLALGYSRNIHKRVSLSIGMNYYHLDIKNSYKTWSIVVDLGGIFRLTPDIRASILYKNINNAHLKVNRETLPKIFATGLMWELNKKVELGAEIYKDILFPFCTKFGAKVDILPHVRINSGIQFDPNRYSIGSSFYWGKFQIEASFRTHLKLPSTLYFGCKISL